mmetsp:Transcript_9614/g.20488  ORF Transcript_9614/g.20488 Transcript_9614/m.20488 type:complete len:225 (-) Transcript_9614:1184-1858(-)
MISRFTKILVLALGRTRQLNSCLPVHSSMGLRMAGVGMSTTSPASDMYDTSRLNSERVRNLSLTVIRYAHVKKSWVAAIMISPFLGVHRLLTLPMSCSASARASSVWGRCRFISSPSKSALKGEQAHSLKRSVRQGRTLALKAMMEMRCREGWRLKSTTSPSSRCRSTMKPTLSSAAILRLSPYLRKVFSPSGRITKLAPGQVLTPLSTRCRSFSMLYCVTRSG